MKYIKALPLRIGKIPMIWCTDTQRQDSLSLQIKYEDNV